MVLGKIGVRLDKLTNLVSEKVKMIYECCLSVLALDDIMHRTLMRCLKN